MTVATWFCVFWLAFSAPARAAETPYVVKAGETLQSIAEARYGHRHYGLLLAKLNKIDGGVLKAGALLKLPELQDMLFKEGLTLAVAPQIVQVLTVRYEFMRMRGDITRALEPKNSKAKVQVPAAVRTPLLAEAAKLEKAARDLARAGGYKESPTRMKQRLEASAKILRELARGAYRGDAESAFHLLYSQAFVRGLMWARKEDKSD